MSDDYISYNQEWDDETWGDFDEGDFAPSNAEREFIKEIFGTYGIRSIGEILVDFDAVADVSSLRGNRFSSFGEALTWLHDIGVLAFSKVVYLGDDEFGAAIPDDSGKRNSG